MSERVQRACGRLAIGTALVLLFCSSCAGVRLQLSELPTDPIAVTYWEPEEARRRAELLSQREEERALRVQKPGVAEVEALGRLFGGPIHERSDERLGQLPGHLSLVDPTTGEVTRIAAAPPGAVPLDWSDDHERLLFLASHRGGRIHVYEYDRTTEEVRAITYGPNAHLFASYGRDSQIAVLQIISEPAGVQSRVYVTDLEGGSPRLVLEGEAETARLSPDGKMLLYVRRSKRSFGTARMPGSDSEIVALDLASGERQSLGPGREPSFSPAGDWIVYSAPSREGWRLRRMRPDGSARSPAVSGIRDELNPSVSPDGNFVVYTGKATGIDRMFVRRIDGSGDRILLDSGAVFSPVW